jgi:thymidylate kinase
MAKITITLDGPRGSGKSTLMKAIARRFGPDVVVRDPKGKPDRRDVHELEIDPSPVFLAALRAENGEA